MTIADGRGTVQELRVLLLGNPLFGDPGRFAIWAGNGVRAAACYDPAFFARIPPMIMKLHWRLRLPWLKQRYCQAILDLAARFRPALVLVGKGFFCNGWLVQALQERFGAIVFNINNDSWLCRRRLLVSPEMWSALSQYDQVYSTKFHDIATMERHRGALVRPLWLWFDPDQFFPETDIRRDSGAEVLFVGNFERARHELLAALNVARPGLRLQIHGAGWQHADLPLRRRWSGRQASPQLARKLIASSALTLAFYRRLHGDQHSRRTFEIPAAGGFMLAERTVDQSRLFVEGLHYAAFGDVTELIAQIDYYLPRTDLRRRIAATGQSAVLAGGHSLADRIRALVADFRADADSGLRAPEATRSCRS